MLQIVTIFTQNKINRKLTTQIGIKNGTVSNFLLNRKKCKMSGILFNAIIYPNIRSYNHFKIPQAASIQMLALQYIIYRPDDLYTLSSTTL